MGLPPSRSRRSWTSGVVVVGSNFWWTGRGMVRRNVRGSRVRSSWTIPSSTTSMLPILIVALDRLVAVVEGGVLSWPVSYSLLPPPSSVGRDQLDPLTSSSPAFINSSRIISRCQFVVPPMDVNFLDPHLVAILLRCSHAEPRNLLPAASSRLGSSFAHAVSRSLQPVPRLVVVQASLPPLFPLKEIPVQDPSSLLTLALPGRKFCQVLV
ncbi:uncharacterized protein LOC111947457 [Oryzias latipes]|uniref:uncharacterized protein LOC111947457 n=1 Tax=Oryzias latipes TaxID=8090 RepID=UPI000CE1695D|nr:uncharacterized protein LOC111947457 [Oryzias latipes]